MNLKTISILISFFFIQANLTLAQDPILVPIPDSLLYEEGAIYLKVADTSNVQISYIPGVPGMSTPETYEAFTNYQITEVTRPFEVLDSLPMLRIYRVYFDLNDSAQELMDELLTVSYIEFAERVPLKFTQILPPQTPNDPSISGPPGMDSYHLNLIRAFDAFDIHQGGNATVAIVDDAVLTSHEDLSTNIISDFDVADGDTDSNPPFTGSFAAAPTRFSHGTHVAGIAGAVTDNGLGIASIGWNNKIMAVKTVKDTKTPRFLTHAYDGVARAAAGSADVINMSWGSYASSEAEYLVLENARSKDIVLVAAAGNNFTVNPLYPAAYGEGTTRKNWEVNDRRFVIAVAALDQNNDHSNWGTNFTGVSGSNYGHWVDVSAYGTDIYSSVAGSNSGSPINNLYTDYDGTSMAAPMVAGLAGLMRSYKPLKSDEEIIDCLLYTANNDIYDPLLHPNNIPETLGTGRINAYDALRCFGEDCQTYTPVAIIIPSSQHICQGGTVQLTANPGLSYAWSSGQTSQSITISLAGTYTVTVTFANGCTASKSIDIQPAITEPVIFITDNSGNNIGDGILCGTDFLQLNAYYGSGYLWNSFGGWTSPNIPNINAGNSLPFTHTFSVTVTDVGGCPGVTGTASVTTTWLELPTADIQITENSQLPNDGIICLGEDVTLTASGGIAYEWNTGSNANSITVSPTSDATYVVTVTDANGCTDETSVTIQVLPNNFIDLELDLSLSTPNPDLYTLFTATATLTNVGCITATGVRVYFPRPASKSKIVYEGGNEYTASQGTFEPHPPWGNEVWDVGDIAPGATATLNINYFLKTKKLIIAYAEVIAANEPDVDSTPGNGIPPTPNEDDEAAISIQAPSFNFNVGSNLNKPSIERSTSSFAKNDLIFVYPNPAKDNLSVLLNSISEKKFRFQILDTKGQLVKSGWIPENSHPYNIDLKTMSAGLYILKIDLGEKGISHNKIIVQK